MASCSNPKALAKKASAYAPGGEVCMSISDGIDRRSPNDRRREERRRSMRYTADTLIVIRGVTWIDNEGTDRRRKVRRREDRERIARRVLDDSFS